MLSLTRRKGIEPFSRRTKILRRIHSKLPVYSKLLSYELQPYYLIIAFPKKSYRVFPLRIITSYLLRRAQAPKHARKSSRVPVTRMLVMSIQQVPDALSGTIRTRGQETTHGSRPVYSGTRSHCPSHSIRPHIRVTASVSYNGRIFTRPTPIGDRTFTAY